jgi:hypothetical protein
MNKSQKGALAVLIITTLLLIFSVTIPFAWFSSVALWRSPLIFLALTLLAMMLSVIFLRRKQSPSEVDYDERDILIKQKAIFASYITLWILVFAASTIWVVIAEHGIFANPDIQKIVMFSPPIVFFLMYIIVKMVYALTILIQYGWKEKGNE